jgi:hypothetical protein
VRRGAAWPPAERPSSLPGRVADSLAAWQVASSSSGHAAARHLCPHSTRLWRPNRVAVPGCPDAHPAPVALSSSSVSVRVSNLHLSGVRPSGVQWPVSARPLSGAGVHHPSIQRRHPRCLQRWVGGARGRPAGSGTGRVGGSPTCPRSARRLLKSTLARGAGAGRAGQRRRWPGTRPSSWKAHGRWPGSAA